jgi:hypothetical protein
MKLRKGRFRPCLEPWNAGAFRGPRLQLLLEEVEMITEIVVSARSANEGYGPADHDDIGHTHSDIEAGTLLIGCNHDIASTVFRWLR